MKRRAAHPVSRHFADISRPPIAVETSLHRRLKEIYASDGGQTEAALGRYRIDVITDAELIEIQHGSLAAIRDKIRQLTAKHQVRVVKPLVTRKHLVKLDEHGEPGQRRLSPKRGRLLDLFHELIYFTRAFPHPNLTLDVPLVEVEELRRPGRSRRRRRRKNDFVMEDRQLLHIDRHVELNTAADLRRLLPAKLKSPFDTAKLAAALEVDRWVAQRVAYCLREMGAATVTEKRGNALLYRWKRARRAA